MAERAAGEVDFLTSLVELRMPIKPPPPVYRGPGDLSRGQQIACSWKLLDRLAPADAEVVAKAIAQGIAEGRAHGLEIAQGRPEWSRRSSSSAEESR
jgi:hypothetical protein